MLSEISVKKDEWQIFSVRTHMNHLKTNSSTSNSFIMNSYKDNEIRINLKSNGFIYSNKDLSDEVQWSKQNHTICLIALQNLMKGIH